MNGGQIIIITICTVKCFFSHKQSISGTMSAIILPTKPLPPLPVSNSKFTHRRAGAHGSFTNGSRTISLTITQFSLRWQKQHNVESRRRVHTFCTGHCCHTQIQKHAPKCSHTHTHIRKVHICKGTAEGWTHTLYEWFWWRFDERRAVLMSGRFDTTSKADKSDGGF